MPEFKNMNEVESKRADSTNEKLKDLGLPTYSKEDLDTLKAEDPNLFEEFLAMEERLDEETPEGTLIKIDRFMETVTSDGSHGPDYGTSDNTLPDYGTSEMPNEGTSDNTLPDYSTSEVPNEGTSDNTEAAAESPALSGIDYFKKRLENFNITDEKFKQIMEDVAQNALPDRNLAELWDKSTDRDSATGILAVSNGSKNGFIDAMIKAEKEGSVDTDYESYSFEDFRDMADFIILAVPRCLKYERGEGNESNPFVNKKKVIDKLSQLQLTDQEWRAMLKDVSEKGLRHETFYHPLLTNPVFTPDFTDKFPGVNDFLRYAKSSPDSMTEAISNKLQLKDLTHEQFRALNFEFVIRTLEQYYPNGRPAKALEDTEAIDGSKTLDGVPDEGEKTPEQIAEEKREIEEAKKVVERFYDSDSNTDNDDTEYSDEFYQYLRDNSEVIDQGARAIRDNMDSSPDAAKAIADAYVQQIDRYHDEYEELKLEDESDAPASVAGDGTAIISGETVTSSKKEELKQAEAELAEAKKDLAELNQQDAAPAETAKTAEQTESKEISHDKSLNILTDLARFGFVIPSEKRKHIKERIEQNLKEKYKREHGDHLQIRLEDVSAKDGIAEIKFTVQGEKDLPGKGELLVLKGFAPDKAADATHGEQKVADKYIIGDSEANREAVKNLFNKSLFNGLFESKDLDQQDVRVDNEKFSKENPEKIGDAKLRRLAEYAKNYHLNQDNDSKARDARRDAKYAGFKNKIEAERELDLAWDFLIKSEYLTLEEKEKLKKLRS